MLLQKSIAHVNNVYYFDLGTTMLGKINSGFESRLTLLKNNGLITWYGVPMVLLPMVLHVMEPIKGLEDFIVRHGLEVSTEDSLGHLGQDFGQG